MNPHLTEWAWPSVHHRSRSVRTIANEPISSKSWLHDISPATLSSSGRELTEQLNALSAKILPGGAFFHRNPANLRFSKVHSRLLQMLWSAFTRIRILPRKGAFSMAKLCSGSHSSRTLKAWASWKELL